MKRFGFILLLVIFLFNGGGYFGVYWYMISQTRSEIDQRLDAGSYSSAETITVKIPLSIPYYFDWKDYEQVGGSYEEEGEFFNLVKRKFENDTLFVVSIKNHEEKKLFDSMIDFFKISNDLTSTSKTPMKVFGGISKDYTPNGVAAMPAPRGWFTCHAFTFQLFVLLAENISVLSPPPDYFS